MLELVTAAAAPVITTAEAKAYLRIVDDNSEDRLIDKLVAAAEGYIGQDLNRSLIHTTWDEHLEGFPALDSERIELTQSPLALITSISYFDENDAPQTLAAAKYIVNRARQLRGQISLAVGQLWPGTSFERAFPVTIRYVAGYVLSPASVPAELLQAAYMLIDDFFRNRGAGLERSVSQRIATAVERLLQHHGTGAYP